MQWFEIEREFRTTLAQAQLDHFEALATQPMGEAVALDKHGCQVRRLTLKHGDQHKTFFLKRVSLESPSRLLRMLIYGRRPRSGPIREQMMLSRLRAAGFPTMGTVAWGEERRFGIPRRGFLLAEGVDGQDLSALFKEASAQEREQLARAAGTFLGRLHQAGFYQPVRFKDMFATQPVDKLTADDLVLIDRETPKPWPSLFFAYYCFRSLKRIHRRNLRDGIRFNDSELKVFAQAYVDALRGRRDIPLNTLLKRVFRKTLAD